MMAKGSGARFTHLVDVPPQVENYDVSAEGFIAVSTIDAERVFVMIGGVMSDNKLVGTGTLQDALAEHLRRKAR